MQAEGDAAGVTNMYEALLRRKPKNIGASSKGSIVKSMYFDSSTVDFVDEPHAYWMSMRRALIS